jgi:hypothetical protein
MKQILIVMLVVCLSGCATLKELTSAAKPKFTPDPEGVHMSPTQDDLKHEFVNLSDDPAFNSKIKSLSYEYMGWIHYEVPYNASTLADVKKTAKQAGGDGIIIWMTGYSQDPLLGKDYGISALVIKLTK